MYVAIGVGVALAGVALYFAVPYSPLQHQYYQDVSRLANTNFSDRRYTGDDIVHLPESVQQHFRACNLIGAEYVSEAVGIHEGAQFYTAVDAKPLTITYTQVNFVAQPNRLAFIDTAMAGVLPFQGYDRFVDGHGAMKGQIAKAITLFDQQGQAMDQACLATVLSECLVVPSIALQDYIEWEAIDDQHARATITAYGQTATGVFTFDDDGRMHSFTTNDRTYTDFQGNQKDVSWTARCEEYREFDGVFTPTSFAAIWHLPEGDFEYFSSHNVRFMYGDTSRAE